MECLLFSSNVYLLVDDMRSFHYFDVTLLKLWRQIKGYCYTKPYFRTDVYNFRTKSTQINSLNIYLLKNFKNWKCENLPIRALFLRCASYEGCSNINASSFITFFTYTLWQNVIPFWKEIFVAFKMAPNIKKHSLYFSSYRPLYKGHSCILKFFWSNLQCTFWYICDIVSYLCKF